MLALQPTLYNTYHYEDFCLCSSLGCLIDVESVELHEDNSFALLVAEFPACPNVQQTPNRHLLTND